MMERMSTRERTFRLHRDTDREIPEHAVHPGYRRQSRRDDRKCRCGTLYRPAPTNSAPRGISRVGAHSNSKAVAGRGFRLRPLGFTISQAMNSAQRGSRRSGRGVVHTGGLGRNMVGRVRLNCELFGGRFISEEAVRRLRKAPHELPIRQGWRLNHSKPLIF